MAIRSRAAMLPWAGDPYLLNFWLKGFRNIWGDEVDKLYVYASFPVEPEAIEFAKSLCDSPNIKFIYPETIKTHGVAIDEMLNHVEEDFVVLIEDDAFVIKKGAIDFYFTMVESDAVDVVGSPRGSCSFEILARAEELWGVTAGQKNGGCNFWPCFLFTKKQTLLDTDRDFDSKSWEAGEYIPELQMVAPCRLNGDTLVNTSLQLRAKGLRIMAIEQFHSYNTDPDDFHKGTYIFSPNCPWFHVGSLSSGFHGVLMDNDNRMLSDRKFVEPRGETFLPAQPNMSEQERMEWQRRVAWWKTFGEQAPTDTLLELRALYEQAVERIIRQYFLRRKEIEVRQTIFKQITGKYYEN